MSILDRVENPAVVLRQQTISESTKNPNTGKEFTMDKHNANQKAIEESMSETEQLDPIDAAEAEFDEGALDGTESEAVVEAEPVQEEIVEEPVAPSLVTMLAGQESVRLTVSPRVILTVNANTVDLPDVVKVGDEFYSTASPMRKSKTRGLTKKDPYGLIRGNLTNLVKYIAGLSGRDVVFFGKPEDLEENVNRMLDELTDEAESIMLDTFGESQELTYPAPEPEVVEPEVVEAEEESDEDEEELEDELDAVAMEMTKELTMASSPVSDLFVVNSWTVIGESEDGTSVVRPTININVNCPILVTGDLVKTLNTTAGIVRNFGKKLGLTSGEVSMAFAFGAEDLNNPAILDLLGTIEGEEGPVVVGSSYIQQGILDPSADAYDLVPVGSTFTEVHDTLFANGGEMLLVFPS